MITRNEGYRFQTRIEIGVEIGDTLSAAIDQVRDLLVVMGAGNRAALQACDVLRIASMTEAKPSISVRRSHMPMRALPSGVAPNNGTSG